MGLASTAKTPVRVPSVGRCAAAGGNRAHVTAIDRARY